MFARPGFAACVPLLIASFFGCHAIEEEASRAPEVREVETVLDRLYDAFGFDAGGEADWSTMRSLFAEGATFVSPIRDGGAARGVGTDRFLADFRDWVTTGDVRETGLQERITHVRVDAFGNVAHAWVVFEGFVPGEEARRTYGLDSLQLIRDEGAWKVISFTSQYTDGKRDMPDRFVHPAFAWRERP